MGRLNDDLDAFRPRLVRSIVDPHARPPEVGARPDMNHAVTTDVPDQRSPDQEIV